MRMPREVLLPRMQHERKGGRAAEPARVGRELGERGRDGAEEHFVERSRALADESIQIVRQGEHQMEIGHR